MDERILKWLYDIRLAITEIESYFVESGWDFNYYKKHPVIKRATERNLEIIGEAVNRILKRNDQFPITSAQSIVALRNHIFMLMTISQMKIFGLF